MNLTNIAETTKPDIWENTKLYDVILVKFKVGKTTFYENSKDSKFMR